MGKNPDQVRTLSSDHEAKSASVTEDFICDIAQIVEPHRPKVPHVPSVPQTDQRDGSDAQSIQTIQHLVFARGAENRTAARN
jgi:hypothetical protein